jgi:hypothetical protein
MEFAARSKFTLKTILTFLAVWEVRFATFRNKSTISIQVQRRQYPVNLQLHLSSSPCCLPCNEKCGVDTILAFIYRKMAATSNTNVTKTIIEIIPLMQRSVTKSEKKEVACHAMTDLRHETKCSHTVNKNN